MGDGAGAHACHKQLARLLLRQRNKFFHRTGRHARMDGECVSRASQLRDRGKGINQIVRELLETGLYSSGRIDDEQCVTIGC